MIDKTKGELKMIVREIKERGKTVKLTLAHVGFNNALQFEVKHIYDDYMKGERSKTYSAVDVPKKYKKVFEEMKAELQQEQTK